MNFALAVWNTLVWWWCPIRSWKKVARASDGAVKLDKSALPEKVLAVIEKAKNNEKVAAEISGKTIIKELYVKGKLVNIVVK